METHRWEKSAQPLRASEEDSTTNPSLKAGTTTTGRMCSARRAVLGFVVLCCVTFGLATASAAYGQPCLQRGCDGHAVVGQEDSEFAKLLKSASPDALHRLLHTYFPDSFKDGVYRSDEDAVEAVYTSDAALATSLVELARRQNSSASSSPDTSSVTIQNTPTPTVSSQAPLTTSTTQPATTPTTPPTLTTSTNPITTPSTTARGTTAVTTPSVSPTSASPAPTTSTTQNAPTSSRAATSSSGPGTTLTTKATFTTSLRTSTQVKTLSGGAVTTITTVEVVSGTATGSSPASSTSSGGGLQTGSAVSTCRNPVLGLAVGIIAFVFIL